jgi:hypothetical protein
MKRRHFIEALAVVPAASATALAAQPPAAAPAQSPAGPPPTTPLSTPPPDPVTYTGADSAADPVLRFFTAVQFTALDRLARLVMPKAGSAPGAADAGAAQFLDFYVGRSPLDRQTLYRAGLDGLNARTQKKFGRAFGDTDDTQADAVVMEYLSRPWSYAPSDPIEAFLRTALRDVRRATQNSPVYGASLTPPPMTNWLRPL